MSLTTGARLGPYQIVSALGAGEERPLVADGRFLLSRVTSNVDQTAPVPITIVVNWTAGIKR